MTHTSRIARVLVLASALLGIAGFAAPNAEEPAAGSTPDTGVLVVKVEPKGPAAVAGVARGDLILALDGKEVATAREVQQAIVAKKPGDTVKLAIRHGDAKRTLSVELGELNGRAYLGVYFAAEDLAGVQPRPRNQAKPRSMPDGSGRQGRMQLGWSGAQIVTVTPNSPAAKAGLEPGDVIATVGGAAVDQDNDLATLVGKHKPGEEIVLGVLDARQATRDVKVTLGENPQDKARPWLGVEYTMSAEDGVLGTMRLATGVPVLSVVADSPAAKAGIAQGDLLTAIGGTAVHTAPDIINTIGARKPGDTVNVGVIRAADGSEADIQITLGENPQDKGKAFLGVQLGGVRIPQAPFDRFRRLPTPRQDRRQKMAPPGVEA